MRLPPRRTAVPLAVFLAKMSRASAFQQRVPTQLSRYPLIHLRPVSRRRPHSSTFFRILLLGCLQGTLSSPRIIVLPVSFTTSLAPLVPLRPFPSAFTSSPIPFGRQPSFWHPGQRFIVSILHQADQHSTSPWLFLFFIISPHHDPFLGPFTLPANY
ncbi:hypothetical protein CC2G_008177 [Coprinopsis cinerea AmutBmut pab1-1]|nr:hypothetical protein CC2G_008177 [Coprinopsis cinerea AmutBmut pab1-1]